MCSRWVRELETAVILELGKCARHPEGERAPAAAELQDVLAVLQLCALAGDLEHTGFGCVDVGDTFVPVAGGVFHIRTEAFLKKGGGELIVLLVGFIGGDGDGHGFQLGDVRHKLRLAVFGIEFLERGDGVGQAVADAEADGGVGKFPGGDEVVGGHKEVKSAE